jgi:hypothetical protein
MKKRIFLGTVIAVCLLLSVGAHTHLGSNSEPKPHISNLNSSSTENPDTKDSTDRKKLVSVDVYSKSDSKHVITLNPQMDASLISQYSKLLEGQSPAKGEDGSDYEVIASYSDGSQSFYGIDITQSELAALCNRTLNEVFAKEM